jgi:hypothetical protein
MADGFRFGLPRAGHERAISRSLGGRSVVDNGPGQLSLL